MHMLAWYANEPLNVNDHFPLKNFKRNIRKKDFSSKKPDDDNST